MITLGGCANETERFPDSAYTLRSKTPEAVRERRVSLAQRHEQVHATHHSPALIVHHRQGRRAALICL